MFKNYFKIALRQLWKHKLFSGLNVVGLTIGMSALLLLLVYRHFEYSFDQFHDESDRIFRVIQTFKTAEGTQDRVNTSLFLADMLEEELAGVVASASFVGGADGWVTQAEKRIFEDQFLLASEDFFEVFDFPVLAGERSSLLQNPNSVVLSESQARKFFNDIDVVGKSLHFERYGIFTVSGVMKDIPAQSSLQFNMVLTQDFDYYLTHVASWFPDWFLSWQGTPARTYVKLESADQKAAFESKLNEVIAQFKGVGWEPQDYYLQALSAQHFSSEMIGGQLSATVVGNERQLNIFSLIALFVLLMAGVNFVNLSTAQAGRRAKEIGVRKINGALPYHLMTQLLLETTLVVFMAAVCSMLLLILAWPVFEAFTEIPFESLTSQFWELSGTILVAILLLSLLAGAYPAFYLSKQKAKKVLKDHQLKVAGSEKMRQFLVGFQFFMVLSLLTSLIVMNQQFSFMTNKQLGFNKENLMVVEVNGAGVRDNFNQIKASLLEHPSVLSVSGFTRVISGDREPQSIDVYALADDPAPLTMDFYGMDEDGLATLDLKLKEGTNFIGNPLQDSTKVLLNETAAAHFDENIVGQYVQLNDELTAQVIGIVEDFHYRSLHEAVGPLVMGYLYNPFESLDDIVVKAKGEQLAGTLKYIEEVHNTYDENQVVTLRFLDELIEQFYESESRLQLLFTIGSLVALLLAILGVVGLTSFLIRIKAKDYSIRRVLGAKWADLFLLQVFRYLYPLIGGSVLAALLVIYILQEWLQDFAYRITLSPWPVMASFAAVCLITLSVIIALGWRSLHANPVEAIRND